MRPIYDLSSAFADHIRTAEDEAGRVYEPVIALVTDNKDPSKLGRVKVKIPILSDTDSSWWAPIIMLGAGKNRGWFFIPEVDDEVLVMFEHGDVNRPLVVGALWGGKDKPPEKNPGSNPKRVIKSRGGNKITFDDDPGSLQIVIEDGTGKGRITLDAKHNKIVIESLIGDVCFQSPTGDTQIVAKEIEMIAGDSLEIHAGSSMAWGAGTKVTVKGSSVSLSGSAANGQCGKASAPAAPEATPEAVADPYGS
ncbi:MAG: phage tail protein [Deltaproteobacteria bacterium]|nr:phage tail protein [Deltaproteobacteria bacterium]